MIKMFLDDERFPVDDDWIIVRTVEEAIAWVKGNSFPDYISFDNDLGKGQREGWEFAQWLIEHDLDTNTMPVGFDFYVHSQNPVRRDDIGGRLRRYLAYKQ